MLRFAPFLMLTLAACLPQTAPGGPDDPITWKLVTLNGKPLQGGATLTFGEGGKLGGQAPCNQYFASYSGDGEAIRIRDIGATMMACEALAAESVYVAALESVTKVQVSPDGSAMVLTGPGTELRYAPQ